MHRNLFAAAALVALCASLAVAEPVTKPIRLFNGKDLTGFYSYLGAPKKGEKPYGKNNDPEKVFTVQDGMIRVSGKEFGCFVTEKEYDNYHLVVEFKWGDETWPPREKATRDSGILLHCVGEDGAAGGVWLESIECQMIEGGTGDFILVKGKNQPTMTARVEKRGGQSYYNPKGEPVLFKGGRINWYGRDPEWKDVKGFRGSQDVEKPVGQWNTLECVCDGDKITNILNGTVVNEGTGSSHTKGKILFQSEGAEVFFRRIELRPLKK
jgi:3-keto-disaccharide hydrolase